MITKKKGIAEQWYPDPFLKKASQQNIDSLMMYKTKLFKKAIQKSRQQNLVKSSSRAVTVIGKKKATQSISADYKQSYMYQKI